MRTIVLLCLLTAIYAPAQIIPPNSLDQGKPGAATLPAVAAAPVEVDFVDRCPLTVHLGPDQTVRVYLPVLAQSSVAGGVAFYLDVRRSRDSSPCRATIAALSSTGMAKGGTFHAPVEITGCGNTRAEGVIGISASTGKQRERRVVIEPHTSRLPDTGVGIPLLLAISVALLCVWIVTRNGHKMGDTIGTATWDFSTSWATNVTAFGTLFAFLLQATVLPDKLSLGTKAQYALMSTLALALVGVAPLVHRIFAQTTLENSNGTAVPVTYGVVAGFLAASTFTVWGALIQIALQIFSVIELRLAGTISVEMFWGLLFLVALAAAGLLVYSVRTIWSTVGYNAARSGATQTAPTIEAFRKEAISEPAAKARKIAVL